MPAEPLSKKTPMTLKQKRLIKYYILCNGNVKEAARRVGINYDHALWLMKQEKVDTALQKALTKAGVTTELLAVRLKEGMDAEYPAKMSASTGLLIQEKSPDYFTRHKYSETIIGIRGDKAPEKSIEEKRIIHLTVSEDMLKGLADAGKIEENEIPVIMGELQHEPIREGEDVSTRDRGREERKEEKETSGLAGSPEESEGKPEEIGQELCGDRGRGRSNGTREGKTKEKGFNPKEEVQEALKRLKGSGKDSEPEDKDRELGRQESEHEGREKESKDSETDR